MKTEQREIVKRCVINFIDTGIHEFLFAINELSDFENDIQIIVNRMNIAKISNGLQVESYGAEGWYAKYSKYGDVPD